MVSWNEITEMIKMQQELVVHQETQDALFLEYTFESGRKQSIIIERIMSNYDEEWVQISSPLGDDECITSLKIIAALEMTAGSICGGVIKCDGIYFLRHSMPIADLSFEEFMYPFGIILKTADDIEHVITKMDIY